MVQHKQRLHHLCMAVLPVCSTSVNVVQCSDVTQAYGSVCRQRQATYCGVCSGECAGSAQDGHQAGLAEDPDSRSASPFPIACTPPPPTALPPRQVIITVRKLASFHWTAEAAVVGDRLCLPLHSVCLASLQRRASRRFPMRQRCDRRLKSIETNSFLGPLFVERTKEMHNLIWHVCEGKTGTGQRMNGAHAAAATDSADSAPQKRAVPASKSRAERQAAKKRSSPEVSKHCVLPWPPCLYACWHAAGLSPLHHATRPCKQCSEQAAPTHTAQLEQGIHMHAVTPHMLALSH